MFIDIFIRTHDFEFAIKKVGLTKTQGSQYLSQYKSIYTAIFEKMGMPKEEVVKKHIELINDPIKSESYNGKTEVETTTYDNATKMKAIEIYYKLTNAIEDSKIIVNTVVASDTDKIKELEIAKIINDDPMLREKFMNVIETSGKGDAK